MHALPDSRSSNDTSLRQNTGPTPAPKGRGRSVFWENTSPRGATKNTTGRTEPPRRCSGRPGDTTRTKLADRVGYRGCWQSSTVLPPESAVGPKQRKPRMRRPWLLWPHRRKKLEAEAPPARPSLLPNGRRPTLRRPPPRNRTAAAAAAAPWRQQLPPAARPRRDLDPKNQPNLPAAPPGTTAAATAAAPAAAATPVLSPVLPELDLHSTCAALEKKSVCMCFAYKRTCAVIAAYMHLFP